MRKRKKNKKTAVVALVLSASVLASTMPVAQATDEFHETGMESHEAIDEQEPVDEQKPVDEQESSYGIMPMALDPDDIDLDDDETTVIKDDESKEKYEMPDNTAYVVLKQGNGTIVVWTTEEATDESAKEQLLEMVRDKDSSIKGDEKVVFISGEGTHDLSDLNEKGNAWGTYIFETDEDTGNLILTCVGKKISHINYVTGKDQNPEDPDKEPEDPDKEPEDPDKEPEDPDKEPEDPDKEPEDPDKEPEDPDKEPEDPDKEPEDPDKEPEDPDKEPEDPDPTDSDEPEFIPVPVPVVPDNPITEIEQESTPIPMPKPEPDSEPELTPNPVPEMSETNVGETHGKEKNTETYEIPKTGESNNHTAMAGVLATVSAAMATAITVLKKRKKQ